jgi:hypothetical protein
MNLPVILVSDDEIMDLHKRRMAGQKYDKVIMELMKKGKFEMRRLGDMEVKDFEPFNLVSAHNDIKAKRALKSAQNMAKMPDTPEIPEMSDESSVEES